MMYFVIHILDLDTLILAITPPVPPCCPITHASVALTLAGGSQGKEGSLLAHNVSTSHLTVTSIATPGSVVLIVKHALSVLVKVSGDGRR